MVHPQSYDYRHSSYHPPTTFRVIVDDDTTTVNNKNYQQQQHNNKKNHSGGKGNNNNNNNSSSSPTSSNTVNDNDTFVRFRPQSANNGTEGSSRSSGHGLNTHFPPLFYPCGPVSTGTNVDAVENDVRWSKLLRHDGTPSKVLLYPEEGWARTATNAYWLLSIPWWNRNRCKVVEVAGTRRSTTQAKLIDAGRGTVYVVGSFKSSSSSSAITASASSPPDLEPEFKLALTSHISPADVNLGYLMTGTLERGHHGDSLQPTHFAVLRRFD